MNKDDIYKLLQNQKIWHRITEHPAVYNMTELENIELPYPNCDAKNLFVRDDKRQNFYLISIKPNKKINLKEFRKEHGTRPLTFASEQDLLDVINLYPGAVTPFGLLNDQNLKVSFYLDEDFLKNSQIIGVHPNDNTATLWVKTGDLINLIKNHGNQVTITKF
jgi:Ala-tRNA(Pro) deacylase